jgi:hypothetical protein
VEVQAQAAFEVKAREGEDDVCALVDFGCAAVATPVAAAAAFTSEVMALLLLLLLFSAIVAHPVVIMPSVPLAKFARMSKT